MEAYTQPLPLLLFYFVFSDSWSNLGYVTIYILSTTSMFYFVIQPSVSPIVKEYFFLLN
jgi:hypothetical protein